MKKQQVPRLGGTTSSTGGKEKNRNNKEKLSSSATTGKSNDEEDKEKDGNNMDYCNNNNMDMDYDDKEDSNYESLDNTSIVITDPEQMKGYRQYIRDKNPSGPPMDKISTISPHTGTTSHVTANRHQSRKRFSTELTEALKGEVSTQVLAHVRNIWYARSLKFPNVKVIAMIVQDIIDQNSVAQPKEMSKTDFRWWLEGQIPRSLTTLLGNIQNYARKKYISKIKNAMT